MTRRCQVSQRAEANGMRHIFVTSVCPDASGECRHIVYVRLCKATAIQALRWSIQECLKLNLMVISVSVTLINHTVWDVLTRLSFATSATTSGLWLFVLLILLDNFFNCYFRWQLDKLVLAVHGVPVIDEIRFQVLRNWNVYFCFVDFLLSFVWDWSVESLSFLLDNVIINGFGWIFARCSWGWCCCRFYAWTAWTRSRIFCKVFWWSRWARSRCIFQCWITAKWNLIIGLNAISLTNKYFFFEPAFAVFLLLFAEFSTFFWISFWSWIFVSLYFRTRFSATHSSQFLLHPA